MSAQATYTRNHHYAYMPEDVNPYKYSAHRMMKLWAINHVEWATERFNKPHKAISIQGTSIYWYDQCIATHHEAYTAVHENKRCDTRDALTADAVGKALVALRKVLTECGYIETTGTSVAPTEDEQIEDNMRHPTVDEQLDDALNAEVDEWTAGMDL